MKMKLTVLMFLVMVFLTGCSYSPYMDGKFGEKAVDAWFSYKNGDDDLGQVRRKIENIQEIEEVTCQYLENDLKGKYVYQCELSYKPIGETVIPLSQSETLKVYAVFIPSQDGTFKYRVYHSDSNDGIWKEDSNLNYGK